MLIFTYYKSTLKSNVTFWIQFYITFMVNHSPFRQFLGEIDPFGPVFRSKKQPRLRSYLANMDLGGFGPINPHSFREHTLF